MARRETRAPYRVGDRANILRDDTGGTVWGPLRIERVTALTDGRTWRISATRHDGTTVEVLVGANGRDPHGYVEPARAPAPGRQLALEGVVLVVSEADRGGEQPSMFGN